MQELHLLNEKLDLLLSKYTALHAENQQLKEAISQQVNTIAGLNGKLAVLEETMLAAQMSNNAIAESEKENMRNQMDSVIGEIDKILKTLHD